MVAQSTERSSATTSAAAASSYGAAGTADALANGVPAHERQQQVNGTMGTQELENPNLHDPAPPPDPRVDASNIGQASALQPVPADPSYEELHQGVNVVRTGVLPTEATTPATEQAEHPTTPANSTVTVQEYFSAESRTATNEQQGVRWMARFTEFLRTTANRGASGVDRVLDGLGIPPIHPETTQASRFAPMPRTSATQATMVVYSPPEELPSTSRRSVAPRPRSWDGPQATEAPLLGPAQLDRMRQAQLEYPHIYGQTSEGGSEHSSRLQAEVQRQLEEYSARHQAEMQRMAVEVQQLKMEKEQWEMRAKSLLDAEVQRSNQERAVNEPPGDPRVQQGNFQQPLGDPHLQLRGDPRVQQGNFQQPLGDPSPQLRSDPRVQVLGSQQSHGDPSRQYRGDTQLHSDPGVQQGNFQQPLGDPETKRGESTKPSAEQWLGNAPGQDPMALLAGGMAQLQAVMLKQLTSEKDRAGEVSPEAVKPGTTALPALPGVSSTTSSVDIMDWLEMIAAPMADLSDGSAEWWLRVKDEAAKSYGLWTNASPVEKLKIQPPHVLELESGRWSRVNSRAASMILLALHENVRQEMVSRRSTGSATALIFRLLTIYQPGGQQEKVNILQSLQQPNQEQDPHKAVVALRGWARWLRRCRDLGVSAPDPSLLARGLTSMTKLVLERDQEVSFRTSLVRSNLLVDTKPSYDSVEQYYHHLLAECEAMAVTSPTSGTTTTATPPSNKPEPKIKPMKTEPKAPPPQPPQHGSRTTTTGPGVEEEEDKRGQVLCRYFGKSFKGCARGAKCPFKHTWEGNEKEKASRCNLCGGKHYAKDCPTKKPGTPPSTSSTTPAGTSKAAPPKAPPSTSTPPSSSNKTVRIDDRPQVQESSSSTTTTSTEQVPDLKEVLADVGKMLKVMTATSMKRFTVKEMEESHALSIKSLNINENDEVDLDASASMATCPLRDCDVQSGELNAEEDSEGEEGGPRGLLDSGASHALKQATQEEYDQGVPVKVTLAGEDTRVLRQNVCGTVLVASEGSEQVQPIVPMGPLIEQLGCSLQWNKGALKLRHPTKGFIKIYLNNNCPEINFREAHRLIKELEKKQLTQLSSQVNSLTAKLEVLRKEEKRTWDELMKDYVNTGCQSTLYKAILMCPVTKDLPSDVQVMVAEGFDPDGGEGYLKDLPLTKRRRRALMRSSSWVLHLYAGDGNEGSNPFDVVPKGGKMILEVDSKASKLWDIHRKDGVYRLLLWAAAKGKITDVIGSPPCSTWPTSMAPTRGPGSYPIRTATSPYGQQPLQPLQQHRVDQETACIMKQLLLWMIASAKGLGCVGFYMDLPQDPERLSDDQPMQASFWSTEAWKAFKSVGGMRRIDFYMGAYGHKARRPTTAATNYPSVVEMNGNYEFADGCVPPSLLKPSELRKWPGEFKTILAQSILNYGRSPPPVEEEKADNDATFNKLSKEQRREWRNHIHNDHQPYRPDCSVCINAQATGYQHKRRKLPGMYALAVDLAGPFKRKGRDMDFDDYKYIMVAAYRCPKEYLSVMGLTELERELYVPSEDEALPEGEDPLALDDEEPSGDKGEELVSDTEEISAEEEGHIDDEVDRLTKKVEYATIYVTRCLRRRTGPAVLQAAKEILLQLRQTGLHVSNIHTDRAREFKAKMFKTWVNDEKLRHTKTSGGDPAANSTAELGVKWAKARVRSLLRSAKADPRDWPMAIDHASSSVWSKAFPSSTWTNPPLVAFGTEVWFRAKGYKGKKEKSYDPDGTRWKKGLYRGPARDVSRGHLILREDGGLAIAKGIKFNIVEPDRDLLDLLPNATLEGNINNLLGEEQTPSRKQLREEIEFISRKAISEGNYTLDQVLKLYTKLEELGDVDFRTTKKAPMTSWYTGAYVHGGKAGVRSNLKEYPITTRFLTSFAKKFSGEKKFSALGITRNSTLGMHRDSHNSRESVNMVIPLSEFKEGGLWVQDDEVQFPHVVEKITPSGQTLLGRVLELQTGKVVEFSPHRWHEVQPWEGERIVLLLYTPRATKLQDEHFEELKEAGFVIDKNSVDLDNIQDEEEMDEVTFKKLGVQEPDEAIQAFIEIDDYDLLNPILKADPPSIPRATLRKSEVQYTQDIESILQDLEVKGKPLEVTHTVSLNDVKKNIAKWYGSAVKEFTNLKDKKKAFKVTKRWNLPEGCKIVPCKGVFTVKPDAPPNFYKRKTRFVACGNHIPEGSMMPEGFDLFAAGLDATSLRTMFAFTAGSDWLTGTTDIRQAFVLAPWLGVPVALQPPSIAFELGLAEPGDMWEVQMSIYGLRESPALWSGFRDQELKSAVWEAEVNGEMKSLRLQQLVSDNQVWKVVAADDPSKALGYMMVYIDDLLITGPPEILHSFFGWVSARWECDELNVLREDHPIRFLGMEIHKVPGGVEIAQHGFISELLRSYNHKGSRSWSQGSREMMVLTPEEEEAILNSEPVNLEGREAEVKQAQKRVGELLWLTGRSRPDLQYITSIMSSKITRAPELVNELGDRLLSYLAETQFYRLSFVKNDDLEQRLDVFTDSSFATSSGKSHGCAVVFWGSSPLSWRSSRQQLVTLSTAESEMVEAVEGTTLGLATKCLLQELLGFEIPMYLKIDNQAAISLLSGSSASWRTRHLRLRSNWVRERVANRELFIQHEPGVSQRADLGTKALTKERLKQLIALWGIVDRRPSHDPTLRRVTSNGVGQQSWLSRLMMFCQVCGTAASAQSTIETEIAWDLYLVVAVLAIAVIGLWEGFKFCWKRKEARLRAMRTKANKTIHQKLNKTELKELQRILSLDPEELTVDQKFRLVELRTRFEATMPPNTSPVPTIPGEMASSSSGRNKQPTTKDQEVQATPAFERVHPPPAPEVRVEMYAGPFYQVPGRDVLHLYPTCWGLRNTGRAQNVQLCRCCTENAGRSLYNRG